MWSFRIMNFSVTFNILNTFETSNTQDVKLVIRVGHTEMIQCCAFVDVMQHLKFRFWNFRNSSAFDRKSYAVTVMTYLIFRSPVPRNTITYSQNIKGNSFPDYSRLWFMPLIRGEIKWLKICHDSATFWSWQKLQSVENLVALILSSIVMLQHIRSI